MLTWLLFYTSLLDVEKTPVSRRDRSRRHRAEPGDPQPADSALRLVLNASQSRRTLSSRFLTDFFGSGVQHIALATDDIFATVGRHARGRASRMLPIPENYYDDLEARTDLPRRADRPR